MKSKTSSKIELKKIIKDCKKRRVELNKGMKAHQELKTCLSERAVHIAKIKHGNEVVQGIWLLSNNLDCAWLRELNGMDVYIEEATKQLAELEKSGQDTKKKPAKK